MEERDGSQGWLFERFLRELLEHVTDSAARSGPPEARTERHPGVRDGADTGVDFIVEHAGRPLLIQGKAQTPQTNRRLASLIEALRDSGQAFAQMFPELGKPQLSRLPEVMSVTRPY